MVYVDVFGMWMWNRIASEGNAALIVYIDYNSVSLRKIKFLE